MFSRVSAELNVEPSGAQWPPKISPAAPDTKVPCGWGNSSDHGKRVFQKGQTGPKKALSGRTAKVTLLLRDVRLTNIGKKSAIGSTTAKIRCAGLGQAEMTIDRKANVSGIGIILSVVFPPADRTQFHGRRRFECTVATARATIANRSHWHVEIDGKRSSEDYVHSNGKSVAVKRL